MSPRIPLPWRRGLFAAYVLALFVLTHWPRLAPPGAQAGSDKLAHFLAYALWTTLAIAAALFGPPLSKRNITRAAALALAWSTLDECSQLIPLFDRHFSLWDITANAAGVLTASALALIVIRPKAEEPPQPGSSSG